MVEGVGTLWIRHAMATTELGTLSHAIRLYTHIKGHTHTLDFLTAFRSAALELLGPVFLCGILVHLALEKLFVHFQEEN